MMTDIPIKVLSTEISITSANSVSNAYAVRLVNPTNGVVVVTVQSNSTTNSASLSLLGNSSIIIEKSPDYLVLGAGILASKVARKG